LLPRARRPLRLFPGSGQGLIMGVLSPPDPANAYYRPHAWINIVYLKDDEYKIEVDKRKAGATTMERERQ
jgi:hypothetical protein